MVDRIGYCEQNQPQNSIQLTDNNDLNEIYDHQGKTKDGLIESLNFRKEAGSSKSLLNETENRNDSDNSKYLINKLKHICKDISNKKEAFGEVYDIVDTLTSAVSSLEEKASRSVEVPAIIPSYVAGQNWDNKMERNTHMKLWPRKSLDGIPVQSEQVSQSQPTHNPRLLQPNECDMSSVPNTGYLNDHMKFEPIFKHSIFNVHNLGQDMAQAQAQSQAQAQAHTHAQAQAQVQTQAQAQSQTHTQPLTNTHNEDFANYYQMHQIDCSSGEQVRTQKFNFSENTNWKNLSENAKGCSSSKEQETDSQEDNYQSSDDASVIQNLDFSTHSEDQYGESSLQISPGKKRMKKQYGKKKRMRYGDEGNGTSSDEEIVKVPPPPPPIPSTYTSYSIPPPVLPTYTGFNNPPHIPSVYAGYGNPPPIPPSAYASQSRERTGGRDLEWNWTDNNASFAPRNLDFDAHNCGITDELYVGETSEEADYLLQLIDDQVINLIVDETNKYQQYLLTKIPPKKLKRKGSITNYKPLTRQEMYLFIGVVMLMAQTKNHCKNEYWNLRDLFSTPQFRNIMPRDRCSQIFTLLHFVDNNSTPPNNKLWKIQSIYNLLRTKFRKKFRPYQDLCIDESVMLWRGEGARPSKRHKWGIRLFTLCDIKTGYICDFIAQEDNELIPDENLSISESVVRTLLCDHLSKNHVLYVDSWCTSPRIFSFLNENNTGACGVVRKTRRHMPDLPKVRRHQMIARSSNNVLCIKWCDRRAVHILTTVHSPNMTIMDRYFYGKGNKIKTPSAVVECNVKKRVLDKGDMLITSVDCIDKIRKWYVKFFFHLIDMAVVNAHSLYLTKTGRKLILLDFAKNVIEQLISRFQNSIGHRRVTRPNESTSRLWCKKCRLHFPVKIPPTPSNPKPRLRCYVCSKTTKRERKVLKTFYMCPTCEVNLCREPCFEIYHTEERF